MQYENFIQFFFCEKLLSLFKLLFGLPLNLSGLIAVAVAVVVVLAGVLYMALQSVAIPSRKFVCIFGAEHKGGNFREFSLLLFVILTAAEADVLGRAGVGGGGQTNRLQFFVIIFFILLAKFFLFGSTILAFALCVCHFISYQNWTSERERIIDIYNVACATCATY